MAWSKSSAVKSDRFLPNSINTSPTVSRISVSSVTFPFSAGSVSS